MFLYLKSVDEEQPGPQWQKLFDKAWPHYKRWFVSEGYRARPGYLTSVEHLSETMPEIMPVYENLCDLAGGGDLEARFLSQFCPPPYLTGCSQVIWLNGEPALIRNYDYSPVLFEGLLLKSNWKQGVMGMSDCLWGLLDGINEHGLVVSLTFGGRKITGEGFGIPLVLRGGDVFCNGLALGSIHAESASDAMQGFVDALLAIRDHAGATLAIVEGGAAGGGVGIVAAADIAVATTTATFSLPEVLLGLTPATIAPFLPQLGHRQSSPQPSQRSHQWILR